MAARVLAELGKHQVTALVASGVDFMVMIALVEATSSSPVVATVIGAGCGAVTNFLFGRHWTFRASDGHVGGQAFRYAAVSGGSLALNALGVQVLAVMLGVYYIGARLAVSLVGSVLWNYPLHRHFVFRRPRELAEP
jgi:putative flippase GtrA